MKIKIESLAIAIIIAATLAASPVGAQETQQNDANRLVIDEITVTARRKTENIQDVPLAITAFSAGQIEAAGIEGLDDVAAFTPGLTFSNLYGEFLAVPVIRGVAPTAVFGENNVAVFIDGVFVSGREGLNARQLDLERIEVLKGPQSTKYGRNAFAGAINYVSARPTEEFEGKGEFTVGNDEKRAARVSVSGPVIGNTLLGRLAVQVDEWAGSYDNSLSRVDVGGYQFKNVQGSLWYAPVDSLDIKWFVYLTDDEIDQSPLRSIAANCEDRMDLPDIEDPDNPGQIITNPDASATSRPQNYCGTIPNLPDDTIGASESAVGEERELLRSSFHINWNAEFGTLTSLTGFSNTEQSAITDGARNPGYVPFAYLGATGPSIFLAEELEVSPGDEVTEISQELRFSGRQDRAFRYDVGAYGYTVETKGRATDVVARVTGENGQRLPDDFNGFYPAPGVVGDVIWGVSRFPIIEIPDPDNPGETIEVEDKTQTEAGGWFSQTIDEIDTSVFATNETDSWSVFGGFEFDIGDRWTADASARYTSDDKKVKQATGAGDSDNWDYWSGRVGLKAQATENVMIYTSIANGKKSGGFDIIDVDLIAPSSEEDPTFRCPDGERPDAAGLCPGVVRIFRYDIEENTSFELGSKGSFWEGRGQYDLALYYIDWNNILMPQVTEIDEETGLPFDQPTGVNQTGGDATVYGIETNMRFLLSEAWSIDLGGSWTDATYDNADLATYRRLPTFWEDTNGDGKGDKGDVSGNDVLRQSTWQGNFTVDYRRPVYQDWDWYNRADVLYQSSQWVGAANQAKIPGRTVVNFRLGLDSGRYQVEFWVRNLLDDDKPVATFRDVFFNNTHDDVPGVKTFDDLFPFRMTVRYPNRRTFGLTARVRF
ncbi:MAG: TonB-dependent receptor [Gammaproteobacteria bacterium]|nr:TonB-dependent receptor [Gammaproteobacteria bacterium]